MRVGLAWHALLRQGMHVCVVGARDGAQIAPLMASQIVFSHNYSNSFRKHNQPGVIIRDFVSGLHSTI